VLKSKIGVFAGVAALMNCACTCCLAVRPPLIITPATAMEHLSRLSGVRNACRNLTGDTPPCNRVVSRAIMHPERVLNMTAQQLRQLNCGIISSIVWCADDAIRCIVLRGRRTVTGRGVMVRALERMHNAYRDRDEAAAHLDAILQNLATN
jgi:hypothetical protein